ncbi:hypothetical protein AMEX_G27228 [Astyanax mexicanus]|uniref:Ig-like domain-containing protein n=1 Tax=Astyanax mexicanus TaxID=7994 RepID=A0A8T2KLW2_ASTMX|nr:hypothetical protein AMEX_G27228 [Astyanax mexicanus]
MERSRAVLVFALLGFSQVISGEEVEIRVRPGDDVTIYSDCVWKLAINPVWFRNCSHHHQPPLMISNMDWESSVNSRYSIEWNESNQTHYLLVKNVSESDLGLYFCAQLQKNITKDRNGVIFSKDVYHYGNRRTRLSLQESAVPCNEPPQTNTTSTSTPPVSDCSLCWKLLVSVCPVCVLLFSVISSTCVYFICRSRNKGTLSLSFFLSSFAEDENVCYASLDLPKSGQKRLKKKKKKTNLRVESSEFSTYSQVKTERV